MMGDLQQIRKTLVGEMKQTALKEQSRAALDYFEKMGRDVDVITVASMQRTATAYTLVLEILDKYSEGEQSWEIN